jgi:hypothetical protein
MARTKEQIKKLNTTRVARYSDAAYTLMQMRALMSNLDGIKKRFRGSEPAEKEKELELVLAEVKTYAGNVMSQTESVLRQNGEEPGQTTDDVTTLWREMSELAYTVPEGK